MKRRWAGLVVALAWAAGAPGHADVGQADASAGQVLAEVRVHGNYNTPDAEVLRLAGLQVGQRLDPASVRDVESRLRGSGRFEEVEVRMRYRSLEPSADVALVILVREHPGPDIPVPGPPALQVFRRLTASGMFMPILRYTDGYGFTYGARAAFVDTLGPTSRISVPVTWGATKEAAVELEKPLTLGLFDRLGGGLAIWRRTNPFYGLDEDRREAQVEVGWALPRHLRLSAHGAYGRVTFGTLDEGLASVGANVTFDTREDPVFPRNALFASADWDRLEPSRSPGVNRVRADLRGYRGVVGQAVISLRLQYTGSDGPLPLYERALLGGAGTLRGYGAGSYSGDNLLGASAELRVPVSSPLGVSRTGFTLFTDIGSVWDHGESAWDARFRRGSGAGVFLLASVFQLTLDVGVRPGGGAHIHLTAGLSF
jgi:outer membrane protein assembly factor BamA